MSHISGGHSMFDVQLAYVVQRVIECPVIIILRPLLSVCLQIPFFCAGEPAADCAQTPVYRYVRRTRVYT